MSHDHCESEYKQNPSSSHQLASVKTWSSPHFLYMRTEAGAGMPDVHQPGVPDSGPKWVRLTPKGTNLGLFQI